MTSGLFHGKMGIVLALLGYAGGKRDYETIVKQHEDESRLRKWSVNSRNIKLGAKKRICGNTDRIGQWT